MSTGPSSRSLIVSVFPALIDAHRSPRKVGRCRTSVAAVGIASNGARIPLRGGAHHPAWDGRKLRHTPACPTAADPATGEPCNVRRKRAESDIGVLIVDDQPYFRRAARQVIAALPGFRTVAEASSGPEALDAVE